MGLQGLQANSQKGAYCTARHFLVSKMGWNKTLIKFLGLRSFKCFKFVAARCTDFISVPELGSELGFSLTTPSVAENHANSQQGYQNKNDNNYSDNRTDGQTTLRSRCG